MRHLQKKSCEKEREKKVIIKSQWVYQKSFDTSIKSHSVLFFLVELESWAGRWHWAFSRSLHDLFKFFLVVSLCSISGPEFFFQTAGQFCSSGLRGPSGSPPHISCVLQEGGCRHWLGSLHLAPQFECQSSKLSFQSYYWINNNGEVLRSSRWDEVCEQDCSQIPACRKCYNPLPRWFWWLWLSNGTFKSDGGIVGRHIFENCLVSWEVARYFSYVHWGKPQPTKSY